MNSELQSQVGNLINRLGPNEFRLACSKVEVQDLNSIVQFIEEFRKPYAEGRVANIGSAAFASPEVWAVIAEESDAAAKRELLADSADLAELNRLEKAAATAKRLADAKEAELSRAWSEYNAIPDKVEAINAKLSQVANERALLDAEKLNDDFKNLFRAALNGAIYDPFAQSQLAGLIVTAPLRKEVLNEVATELESELATLKARSKVLAKKLGQRS